MELLRATDLVYRHPSRPEPLLRGASLVLRAGERVGLVGRNGVGKSTLLKLLVGQLTPDEGRVVRAPGLRVAYLPQGGGALWGTLWENAAGALEHLRRLEVAMRAEEVRLSRGEDRLEAYGELSDLFARAGGYQAEATLQATLGHLGFSERDYGRNAASLSGGERARLALARALAQRPDLLLLDEPSTFLDLPTRRWLEEALKSHPAALMLASHDRALLDAACTHTVHLSEGRLTRYRGSYSRFRVQSEHKSVSLARQTRRGAQARARLAARVSEQPTALRKRALQQRLARMEASATTAPTPARTGAPLELRVHAAKKLSLSAQPLLDARHLSAQRGERTLLTDGFLRLYAGEKLAVVGANGSGKTTLLHLLAGAEASAHPQAELTYAVGTRLALFDQHARGLADGVPVGEQLARYVSEPRARSLLALTHLSEAWDTLAEALSGGERARAGLALVMATEANLLLLDEPSEQLDAEMTERLEAALAGTEAAVVLVSHDAALVDGVAERVLSLEDGELREYRGGLKGFFAGTLRLEPALTNAAQDTAHEPESAESLEAQLERLEDEAVELEARLADPTGLSERDRERFQRRLSELTHERAERYDARLLPPAPAYETNRSGVTVSTDGVGQPVVFESSAGLRVQLFVEGNTGHLVLASAQGRSVLPWAQGATLRGVVKLAFEHLGLRVLQLQREDDSSTGDLNAASFQPAGGGWWLLDRDRYERLEGYVRGDADAQSKPRPKPQRKHRLAFATDYAAWAASRGRRKP